MLLGLDPATVCGWALISTGAAPLPGHPVGRVRSGRWKLRRGKHEGQRYLDLEMHLAAHLDGVTAIAVEDVKAHKGTAAAHVYGGLRKLIAKVACKEGLPLYPVSVGAVKKLATGNGKASKGDMIRAFTALVGAPPVDDNEADALFVALQGWRLHTAAGGNHK